ncbi:MAG: hypothetical protein AAGJ18_26240 [Bacteroidota bacterium]
MSSKLINPTPISRYLLVTVFFSLLFFTTIACSKDSEECNPATCKVRIGNGESVSAIKNVSGGEGTHITADVINQSDITERSALVEFKVLRIGGCHQVIGYGHTWSAINATPKIGIDYFTDYGDNINFNDEVATLMTNLRPNTKYWVRSWIAVEKLDCTQERVIFYNDTISAFTTP